VKVLIGGEFSGRVRDEFIRRGHDAVSCDYRPSEAPGPHLQTSWFDHKVVNAGWDLGIFHPDCTFLTASGARWMSIEWREEALLMALHTVKAIWKFPIPRIAVENPMGRLSSLWRGPDQIVQPYHFGDPFRKTTGLWLKNLPRRLTCWPECAVRVYRFQLVVRLHGSLPKESVPSGE
jgi:hypothetical protein